MVNFHASKMISHRKRYPVFILLSLAMWCFAIACNRNQPTASNKTIVSNGTVIPPTVPPPGAVTIGSMLIGGVHSTSVAWYVSTNVLSAQPKWDGFTKQPPLSVQSACEIALAPVREKLPQIRTWLVAQVDLRNLFDRTGPDMHSFRNVWCYQITFTPSDPDEKANMEEGGLQFATTQMVLLDGAIVSPSVTVR
jgi:hypothetical protein